MSISKSEPAGWNSHALHDLPSKETLVLKWKFNISRQSGGFRGHLHTKGPETRLSPEFGCNCLTLILMVSVQRGVFFFFFFYSQEQNAAQMKVQWVESVKGKREVLCWKCQICLQLRKSTHVLHQAALMSRTCSWTHWRFVQNFPGVSQGRRGDLGIFPASENNQIKHFYWMNF